MKKKDLTLDKVHENWSEDESTLWQLAERQHYVSRPPGWDRMVDMIKKYTIRNSSQINLEEPICIFCILIHPMYDFSSVSGDFIVALYIILLFKQFLCKGYSIFALHLHVYWLMRVLFVYYTVMLYNQFCCVFVEYIMEDAWWWEALYVYEFYTLFLRFVVQCFEPYHFFHVGFLLLIGV